MKIHHAVALLIQALQGKDLHMSGEMHYQPKALKPYLGYDQRVGWQILVEWFWLQYLAKIGKIPAPVAELLTEELLKELLTKITTTKVTEIEREVTKHDIRALIHLMKEIMPKELHAWIHYGATSYDIISTAYALQFHHTFSVFYKKAQDVSNLWKKCIVEDVATIQMFRTHLQDALPGTVGLWLAVLHSRFFLSTTQAAQYARELPGKFSGAVGTKAAMYALLNGDHEEAFLETLGLPAPRLSTQIVMPESNSRFFHELVLLSGALANFGGDVRYLQSSDVGELMSASSTSSTMAHKKANPIAAENVEGMHTSVVGEYLKVLMTLQSNLQRDLRWSNVMRGFGAILVFVYQQLLTTERILKSLKVNKGRCIENFHRSAKVCMGELLHLSLQEYGYPDSHILINDVLVPYAMGTRVTLIKALEDLFFSLKGYEDTTLYKAWEMIPEATKNLLANPELYIGNSIQMAKQETSFVLEDLPLTTA